MHFNPTKFPPEPLKCNFPCPCKKCAAERVAAAAAKKVTEDFCAQEKELREKAMREAAAKEADDNDDQESEINSTNSFVDFVAEAISILCFLLILCAVFWITVTEHLVHIGIKIYNSDRNTHIAVLIVFVLLTLSITYTMLFGGPPKKKPAPPPPQTLISPIFPYSLNTRKKSEHITLAPKDPAKFNESNIASNTPMQTKNITVTITDSEAKEIFRQSKLFAVPTEMKRPPALLVYLQNVILNNY